jgi:threonine aldolase
MNVVDLRSDTVTIPTLEMRKAMAEAVVGDDVYGEDQTVNRLQEMAATMMGKEAGLFVASGTMGNLAAIMAHCGRGDEVIVGNLSHTFLYEAGGISALGGIHSCQILNHADGSLALEDISAAIRPDDPHHPTTRLVVLENTHNRCGGVALTVEYLQAVKHLVNEHGLLLHMDGARIFNAAVALGVEPIDLATPADSVTFCLSKGLCAPVGSVLCGSNEFIQLARRIRKQLGGGMRQAGILAGAGIVALDTMVTRLNEDHDRARELSQGLSGISSIIIDPETPRTNMVFISLTEDFPLDAIQVKHRLLEFGVRVGVTGARRFRLVTHYWIDDAGIEQALSAFANVCK